MVQGIQLKRGDRDGQRGQLDKLKALEPRSELAGTVALEVPPRAVFGGDTGSTAHSINQAMSPR